MWKILTKMYSAPIFTKLATAELNYVGISYTEFNPNGSVCEK